MRRFFFRSVLSMVDDCIVLHCAVDGQTRQFFMGEDDNLIVSIVVFSLFFKFIVVFFVKLFADIKIVLTFAAHNKGNSK